MANTSDQDARIAWLEGQIAELMRRMSELEAEISRERAARTDNDYALEERVDQRIDDVTAKMRDTPDSSS